MIKLIYLYHYNVEFTQPYPDSFAKSSFMYFLFSRRPKLLCKYTTEEFLCVCFTSDGTVHVSYPASVVVHVSYPASVVVLYMCLTQHQWWYMCLTQHQWWYRLLISLTKHQ